MKKIVSMIVAVAMMAPMTSAFAFGGESVAHCGVNESRLNPTELSAYQECWLDVYAMDETHGVIGSLFWVRAGGEYYSTQLKNLRTEAQRTAWLGMIQADLMVEIETAVELNDGINEVAILQAELSAMTAERDELLASLSDAEADVAAKAAEIVELNATISAHVATIADRDAEIEAKLALILERKAIIQDRDNTIKALKASIAKKDALIAERKAIIEARDNTIKALKESIAKKDALILERKAIIQAKDNVIKALNADVADLQGQIDDLNDELEAVKSADSLKQARIVNALTSLNAALGVTHLTLEAAVSAATDKISALELQISSMYTQEELMAGMINAQNAVLAKAVEGTSVVAGSANINSALKTYEAMLGVSNVFSGTVPVTAPVTTNFISSHEAGDVVITVGEDETVVFSHNFAAGVMKALSDAEILNDIAAAVEAAYDDGYGDGYEAGYVDGFRDGVDSVKNAS